MISDCPKCWETPCICGYDYRDRSLPWRIKVAAAVLGVSEKDIEEKLHGVIPAEHPKKELGNEKAV